MILRNKLNITQEEQEYLTNELFQRFKTMMNNHGLEKVSEQVETMIGSYDIDNVNEINVMYKQIFKVLDIEYLLNEYRKNK